VVLSVPATTYELGLFDCVTLAALLAVQAERLAVTPTPRMTLAAMARLRERGVIEVPWPAARWECAPDAHVAPIEQLQWRLVWPRYDAAQLPHALEDYFQKVALDPLSADALAALWGALSAAEAERFFEHQLYKHRFDGEWAGDLAFVHRDLGSCLSIAQWRYCAWAAVRQGAAKIQRDPHLSPAAVRETVYRELARRAGRLAQGDWAGCALPPFEPRPQNAAGCLFVETLAHIGMEFWTQTPHLNPMRWMTEPHG
jgi:hypothetical protein